MGEVAVKRWIVHDPFVISGARPYQSGDPLKDINWQATARAGSLQVHKHDFTADYRLMIMLNIEDHEGMWETVNDSERIEYGIRYAAGAAQFAAEQGLEFGFASNGHDIDSPGMPIIEPLSAGGEQLEGTLTAMARLSIARSIPFDVLVEQMANRLPDRCDVVIVSAFWSEKLESAAERLRSEGHGVYWVNIGIEKEGAAA
nr:DUF58 domain-containing protein [Paenibacillus phyllosphaerae]